MKKVFSLLLALSMVLALTACGGNAAQETTAPVNVPASALEIMETVWGGYTDNEKFPVIGGSMSAPVNDGPGAYDLTDEAISYSLLIPADQLKNVTEAASMIHMMNANTFTGAVYHLAEGVSAADFGAAMKEAVMNNQWMCGFPETLVIKSIAGEYVMVAFGVNDIVTPFLNHLAVSYPEAETLIQEAIA